MTKYIIRRFLGLIPTLFVIITLSSLSYESPLGPFSEERALPKEVLENIEKSYHLDESLLIQNGRYVLNILRGDLGPSFRYKDYDVNYYIRTSLPNSMVLGLISLSLAVEYYKLLKAELEDRVARHVGAIPVEQHRFYWDGPPIWCALRPLSKLLREHGTAVVGSTFCAHAELRGINPDNPIESLARTYMSIFPNRSADYKAAYLAARFAEFGMDGAIYHECRTYPESSDARYGLEVRVRRLTGLPSLVVEADSHDERLFSIDRLQSILLEFLELDQRRRDAGAH